MDANKCQIAAISIPKHRGYDSQLILAIYFFIATLNKKGLLLWSKILAVVPELVQ